MHKSTLRALREQSVSVSPVTAVSISFQDKSTRKEKALKHNFDLRDVITYFHLFLKSVAF